MPTELHFDVATAATTRRKPDWAIVHFNDVPHLLHVRALRQALLARAIAGEFRTVSELGKRIGASRSTMTRFFAGRTTSLDIALRSLKELKLAFEDVCRPLETDLLDRLIGERAIVERGGVTILTGDPRRLLAPTTSGRLPAEPRPGGRRRDRSPAAR